MLEWIGWLRDDLRRRGFIDGQNVQLLVRFADGNPDRYADLARELAAAGSRMIITSGTTAVTAVQSAAPAIPIVMAGSADPVAMGLARSLARPGGNITGVSIMGAEMIGKRIELLKDALPSARAFAAFLQGANPGNDTFRRALDDAGRALGVRIHARDINSPEEIEAAFDWASQLRVDGVFLIEDPMFASHRETIFRIATARRLPTVAGTVLYSRAGALVAYSINNAILARDTARYIAEILRGANPGELAIEQPTAFYVVINLKTAKALGITIPESLLARADEVIE
jgi:putative ABC transport system substrate-binding protein